MKRYFFPTSGSASCAARNARIRRAHAGQLMHGTSLLGIWQLQLKFSGSPI